MKRKIKIKTADLDDLLKDNPHAYQIKDLIEKPDDYAVLLWGVVDVQALAPDLPVEQCREVLHAVEHYQDAELGVTWDTLAFYIEEVGGEPDFNGLGDRLMNM